MATVNVVRFNSPSPTGGTRRVSYDYDDQTLFITAVRMFNSTTDTPLPVKATMVSTGRTVERTEPPNGPAAVEFVQAIPTGAANRFELFVDAKGRLDGVDWQIG